MPSFFHIGLPQVILILLLVIALVGLGKLPQVSSALGKTLKAFRTGRLGKNDGDDYYEEDGDEEDEKSNSYRTSPKKLPKPK
ncbi:MAG: twin-arginine translocase TatA/TatE family subunit [Dehalococcoidia bacterium]|nr:twin-arginine translocase TatA/TatE family subunit [Dehalococcoidia bacterium]